jgi:hypothetical protein
VAGGLRYVGPPIPWINVTTFLNSWVNYGGADQVARYRRIGDMVYVEGVVRAGPTNGWTTVFNLPIGFRPPLVYAGPIYADNAAVAGLASLAVQTSGDVQVWVGTAQNNSVGLYLGFSVA